MSDLLQWMLANWANVLMAMGLVLVGLVGLMRAVVAMLLLIPGDQKEAKIGAIADKVSAVATRLAGVKKPE